MVIIYYITRIPLQKYPNLCSIIFYLTTQLSNLGTRGVISMAKTSDFFFLLNIRFCNGQNDDTLLFAIRQVVDTSLSYLHYPLTMCHSYLIFLLRCVLDNKTNK